MTDRPMGFDTLAIHAATAPDPATGARQVPIYQTTAYVFRAASAATCSVVNAGTCQSFRDITCALSSAAIWPACSALSCEVVIASN